MDGSGSSVTSQGPTGPHALSLWNFTASPGWTEDEMRRLRLCLMVFGVGRWSQIAQSGHLVGKTISQLNLQTQRLLGQQSLAEFTGLRVDAADVFVVNQERIQQGAKTKMGVVVNQGPNPSRDVVMQRLRENRTRFALSEERARLAERELRSLASERRFRDAENVLQPFEAGARSRLVNLIREEMDRVSRRETVTTDKGLQCLWVMLSENGALKVPPFSDRVGMDDAKKEALQLELKQMLQVIDHVSVALAQGEKENHTNEESGETAMNVDGAEQVTEQVTCDGSDTKRVRRDVNSTPTRVLA